MVFVATTPHGGEQAHPLFASDFILQVSEFVQQTLPVSNLFGARLVAVVSCLQLALNFTNAFRECDVLVWVEICN